MDKILILHGLGGSHAPHWQHWLAQELVQENKIVAFPTLENEDNPSYEAWKLQVKKLLKEYRPNILVCHSLACSLWLRLCAEREITYFLQKLILVAPPTLSLDLKETQSFFPFNIPENLFAKEALLITSNNDPYMEKEEAKDLASKLDVTHLVLENAGHINADSGFGEWPLIKEKILISS